MTQSLSFLISIERRNDNGIDVESFVNSASCAIADRAKYKFRVVGEAKVIAILQVQDESVVDTVTSDIMKMGPYTVICTSLTRFEWWAQFHGIRAEHIQPAPNKLSGKLVAWFEISLAEYGMTQAQVYVQWMKYATATFEQRRKKEVEIDIFKVLGERRFFISVETGIAVESLMNCTSGVIANKAKYTFRKSSSPTTNVNVHVKDDVGYVLS